MQKLGLGHLLRLLVLVPLLALAGFGGILVLQSLGEYRETERVSLLQRLVSATTYFAMTGLPSEGRATYAYWAAPTEDARNKLNEQRAVTDRAFAALKQAAAAADLTDAKSADLVQTIETRMSGLAEIRQKADARSITRLEMGAFLQPTTARPSI
jgi:hypothetical protein